MTAQTKSEIDAMQGVTAPPTIKRITHLANNDPRELPLTAYLWTDGIITWTKLRGGVEQSTAPMTGDAELPCSLHGCDIETKGLLTVYSLVLGNNTSVFFCSAAHADAWSIMHGDRILPTRILDYGNS